MAKPKAKALPRRERSYPQGARVFSTVCQDWADRLLTHNEKCFTPWSDYMKLERKYLKLFKRYQKLQKGLKNERT